MLFENSLGVVLGWKLYYQQGGKEGMNDREMEVGGIII